jgi:hypothetical protein
MRNRYASLPGEVTRVSLYASKNPLDPPFVTVENLSALNLVCFGLTLLNEHLRNGNNLELRAYDNNGRQTGYACYHKENQTLFLREEKGEMTGFLDQHQGYLETRF